MTQSGHEGLRIGAPQTDPQPYFAGHSCLENRRECWALGWVMRRLPKARSKLARKAEMPRHCAAPRLARERGISTTGRVAPDPGHCTRCGSCHEIRRRRSRLERSRRGRLWMVALAAHKTGRPPRFTPLLATDYFGRSGHDCKRWYLRPMIDYLVD